MSWSERVRAWCDPVFAAADCGFTWNDSVGPEALLWEAEAELFAARYPDSGIVESYGAEQWPAPCLDYWVYVESRTARLSVEGWDFAEPRITLTGDGDVDGKAIAAEFARILRVDLGPGAA